VEISVEKPYTATSRESSDAKIKGFRACFIDGSERLSIVEIRNIIRNTFLRSFAILSGEIRGSLSSKNRPLE
jgi:hypothetical protein